jgi:hypothetical protein
MSGAKCRGSWFCASFSLCAVVGLIFINQAVSPEPVVVTPTRIWMPTRPTPLPRQRIIELKLEGKQSAAAGGGATTGRATTGRATNSSATTGRATTGRAPHPTSPSVRLVRHPLPNCSVVFFHHIEKTAGTTLRSIFQRQAQRGEYDLISFVNRFDKVQLQMVLHRLWSQLDSPATLTNTRLAVEIHIGGHLSHPYFLKYTLPDLVFLRSRLRQAGCQCNLVTLLRHPLLHHLSWHNHFVNHRVPLCYWRNPSDCQSRMAMGLTCHDGPRLTGLEQNHKKAVTHMWRSFDLVGVTELFDEFVLRLTDMLGLQAPAYRMQIVAQHTVAKQVAQRIWTNYSCARLLEGALGQSTGQLPAALTQLLDDRMHSTMANTKSHQRSMGRSSTGGAPGVMECRGYGPCLIPGLNPLQQKLDTSFEEAPCRATSARSVFSRLCGQMDIDETIYFDARRRFEAQLRDAEPDAAALEQRLGLLRAEGAALETRARRQASVPRQQLEARAGNTLQRSYISLGGEGVPWKVDETEDRYNAAARARYSCVNCSGDVVPEKDLSGCWPLWPQFAPDEMRYRCERRWTLDPALDRPKELKAGERSVPCWQTCWVPMKGGAQPHCMPVQPPPSCGAKQVSGREWRDEWDQALSGFLQETTEGVRLSRVLRFVEQKNMRDFIFNIY